MKICSLIVVGAIIMVFSHFAGANQADDTTIRITGQTAGATPFISKVSLAVSNTTAFEEHSVHNYAESRLCYPATVRHLCQFVPD